MAAAKKGSKKAGAKKTAAKKGAAKKGAAKKGAAKKAAKRPVARKAAAPKGPKTPHIVHFEVHSKDREKAEQFYRDVFGWKIQSMPEMNYGMVDAKWGEAGINGGISGPQPGGGGQTFVTVYVEVKDINEYLAKVERLGGRTLMPRTPMSMVTFAMFSDLDGNVVGLVENPN